MTESPRGAVIVRRLWHMPTDSHTKEEIVVQGISASQGIAYGQIFVYIQSDVEVPSYLVDPAKRIDEIGRFERAGVAASGLAGLGTLRGYEHLR